MSRRILLMAIAICTLALLFGGAPSAMAQSFSDFEYRVDSFEVSWGANSADDDFADGAVTPWYVDEGTVDEANGFLILTTPGRVYGPMPAGDSQVWGHRTRAIAPGPFHVEDGTGNYTATSQWQGDVPGLNEIYGMTLESYWGTGEDYIGIYIANWDDDMASIFGGTSGLYVNFSKSVGDVETGIDQNVVIDPADIIGDVVFRMTYDDAADELSAAFSLDGGTTFQSPFSPFASDLNMDDSSDWYLDAQELQVPEPATLGLLALGGLTLIRRRCAA